MRQYQTTCLQWRNYLAQAIDSILNQTFDDFEVIISDTDYPFDSGTPNGLR